MSLTAYQREVCSILATNRRDGVESYVAGGAALNEQLNAPRISRDIDLFHDTQAALQASWESDRLLLEARGFVVTLLRDFRTFLEARVSRGVEEVTLEWAQDSAFRFFPLIHNPIFGLCLDPFDLATNKALALVGRLEVRDWVDLMESADRLQPLGYLVWAACGKDPGYNPEMILNYAARAHYPRAEFDLLRFDGPAPDPVAMSRHWKAMLTEARQVVDLLPAESVGTCVLDGDGELFQGDLRRLQSALTEGRLQFRSGSIRGVLPTLVSR